MRTGKISATIAVMALLTSAAACVGSGSDDNSPKTLTYWASNQGTSLDNDRQVLQPELDKFQQQTGIKVNLEIIPWADLLNRILAATTSGRGPDVLNIGNTWSASLQATGAFLALDDPTLAKIGGKERFLGSSFAATGAAGKTPTSVPLYSLAYALFYNKKMFADAGISKAPETWDEFVAAGKKLTHGGQWGLAIEGASYTENVHHAFILGQQHGAEPFDAAGKPQFDSPQQVAAVKQFVDFLATDKIVNPSNAESSSGTDAVTQFANGKAAMLMWQNAMTALANHGMEPDAYGVAPIPLLSPLPAGGKQVTSFVAGINISIFDNTRNRDAALEFVKFMTSTSEQRILNSRYGSLPVAREAYDDPAFQTPVLKVFQQILSTTAVPLPQVPQESQFETLVGTAMKDMLADAASGKPITTDYVRSKLSQANQQMQSGG